MRPLLPWLALLAGCAVPVRVESVPPGALVTMRNGTQVYTPAELVVRVPALPRSRRVVVTSPDHRPIEGAALITPWRYPFEMLRPATWLGKPRREVTFLLIPEHGGVGEWTPESEGIDR